MALRVYCERVSRLGAPDKGADGGTVLEHVVFRSMDHTRIDLDVYRHESAAWGAYTEGHVYEITINSVPAIPAEKE